MVTTLYLVRHGETDSNIERRFQGRRDIPLNENGRHQSELLGQAMKDCRIDEIFSSYLARAKETAEKIACFHQEQSVTICPGLEEVDVGDVQGQYLDVIAKEMPELFRCMSEDQVHLQYPGGESCRDVYDRITKTIAQLVEQNRGKTIVVVSHGFAIQMYLHYASGKAFEEMGNYIVANTSRSKFLFEDGSVFPQTVYINRHDHLSADDFTEWKMEK